MAAAGGGDEPRRPPGQAHEYGPYKKLLLGIFEDMDNAEYKNFKHHLDCVVSSDNVSIPKYRIEGAKRQKMPDLILRYIQRREALDVVARILQDLPNVQLLERIRQFTHPEPGTAGYIVMQVKHAAESEADYLTKCQEIAAVLNRCSPGLGNLILDEVRRQECVLVKYLLYVKELSLARPTDVIQKMSSEESKEELRCLGVIYVKVEDATLFTGELHGDPRTWDPVEVTQWVARILLPRDQTATIPDLEMTGAEICTRPETWFTDKFPAGKGRVLYSDLQQRRDDVARHRRFGGSQENERVVEGTSASFLVSAYLMSMVLTLFSGHHREKAERILQYMQSLMEVTKRRSKNEKLLHSGHFSQIWAKKNIIKERRNLPYSEASVVFGSDAIAISSEAYSQVVTSAAEAMEVIGAPLEIKIKEPWWEWKRAIRLGVAAVGGAVGGAAVAGGAVVGAFLLVADLGAGSAAAAIGFAAVYKVLTMALYKSAKEIKDNYSQALIFLLEVLREREMTEEKLQQIANKAEAKSKMYSIRNAENKMMEILHQVSRLPLGIPPSRIQQEAHFDYRARKWLHDDSIANINDTMVIAFAHFELRRLLRDMFVLGVVGSKGSGKNTMVKSVFPEQRAQQASPGPYDVKLCNGSKDIGESTLPVLLFPSGQRTEVDIAHKLCTGVCGAFICVVEYVAGSPVIGALGRVENLSVPVLLCVNKCGRVKDQREASQILDRYKTQVSRDFKGLERLTEVVLTDFQTTDPPAWLTGAEGVKYWIKDAIQNHKRYVNNARFLALTSS
ncbi:Hypp7823 [Branchiostoma lanceolatum]|nr:Hypp7823 [Branchiostoma lanceolatum]